MCTTKEGPYKGIVNSRKLINGELKRETPCHSVTLFQSVCYKKTCFVVKLSSFSERAYDIEHSLDFLPSLALVQLRLEDTVPDSPTLLIDISGRSENR